jgi:hypothetical protein
MGAVATRPAQPALYLSPCKIKFIIKGLKSDPFINELKSADFSGISVEVSKHDNATGESVVESINDLGTLQWESAGDIEGFVYELKEKYKKGAYSLQFTNNASSLFFVRQYDVYSGANGAGQEMTDGSMLLSPDKFQERYWQDEGGELFLYLVLEVGLRVCIDCEVEGASEGYLYQKADRKSLVVPYSHSSGYYEKDAAEYPSCAIARGDKNFDRFLDRDDGSISFKAVNYRKGIYTGDGGHLLRADKKLETGVESEYYHTEYLENKVFVMVECNDKRYLYNYEAAFEKLDTKVKGFNDLKIYKEKATTMYVQDVNKRNRWAQMFFIHMKFDGTTLEYKEVLLEQIGFDVQGAIKC